MSEITVPLTSQFREALEALVQCAQLGTRWQRQLASLSRELHLGTHVGQEFIGDCVSAFVALQMEQPKQVRSAFAAEARAVADKARQMPSWRPQRVREAVNWIEGDISVH